LVHKCIFIYHLIFKWRCAVGGGCRACRSLRP
jgi:hypothetical protein